MQVRAFFLCEHAVRRANGGLDVLGFDLRSFRIPPGGLTRPVALTVICAIDFAVTEMRRHTVTFLLMDPDGERLTEMNHEFDLVNAKGPMSAVYHGPFPALFKRPGPHRLALLVNGQEVFEVPLDVTEVAPRPGPGAQSQ